MPTPRKPKPPTQKTPRGSPVSDEPITAATAPELIVFPEPKPDPKRARYEIGPSDSVKTELLKDGKLKLTIPVVEVFPNIVLPPDEFHKHPRLKRQKQKVTVVFPSPYMAWYLSKNRKTYDDFLRAVRTGLGDSYAIIDRAGRRGRPVDLNQEHLWWMARGLYPHLLDRLTKDPALARRLQAKLGLRHSRADRPRWTPSKRQLALAILETCLGLRLRSRDPKELREHGLRRDAERDPTMAPYADEALTSVIATESTGASRD